MKYAIRFEYAGRDNYLHTDDFNTAKSTAIALVEHKQTAIEVWEGSKQCGGYNIDWKYSGKACGVCFATAAEYRAYYEADPVSRMALLVA